MKKYFWFLIIILLMGCGKESGKLRLGLIKPSLDHLPVDYAIDQQLLHSEDIEIVYFNSGWETNEALITNNIDVAILPFTYIITDVACGEEVKIVSFLERESDGIISRSDIKKVEDLDNKKIGVLKASTLDILAEDVLQKNKLNSELVYLRTPMDLAASLKSGEVDALSFYSPSILKFDNQFNVIHWYANDFPNHPCCDIAATTSALNNKSKQLNSFLKSMEQSCELINSDIAQSASFAAEHFGLDYEVAKSSLKHTPFMMDLAQDQQKFELEMGKIMLDKGYIEKIPTAEELYKQN